MTRVQQTIELEGQPPKEKIQSPTGFVLGSTQKAFLLVLVGGLLFMRLWMRKRKQDKICPHCNFRNPSYRTNCTHCSAPLFEGLAHTAKKPRI